MLEEIDPLVDPRWSKFLAAHPDASIFHTSGWLQALRRTYGHKPAALLATGRAGELAGALVFCRLQSRFRGRRLVSLPFSDHCSLIFSSHIQAAELLTSFQQTATAERSKSTEIRPDSALPLDPHKWQPSRAFYLHRLDLRPGAAAVFEGFHKDCIRRRIRHAEREKVTVSEGKDSESVRQFYALLIKTRRRHGVPPQPLAWFENLISCLGQSAIIHCARKDGQPIAAILTLLYGKTLYYKYGASDARFHDLGGMPYLFWHAIQKAISDGLEALDLGRSDCDNPGLIRFKERLGAKRAALQYWESLSEGSKRQSTGRPLVSLAHLACRHLPDRFLAGLGELCYRHMD
ncbi:MAG TPA: GNAT family N-acetyltransferase [Bryobacteraceae bacterium]|jgi:CelD/BcsL family acetyltransferase involved in cellulose biosynthesis